MADSIPISIQQNKNSTIAFAAKKALSLIGTPQGVNTIWNKIVTEKYYIFNTEDSTSILRSLLDRYSINVIRKDSISKKLFYKRKDAKYGLLEWKNDIVLIGSSNTIRKEGRYNTEKKWIKDHRGYTSRWSYSIRENYLEKIKELLPIKIYLYTGENKIEYVYWIDDFKTMKSTGGIKSPWSEQTEPHKMDKTHFENNGPSIKTWFKVISLDVLDPPKKLDDFIDYDTNRVISPYVLRNSFAYAKEKATFIIDDIQAFDTSISLLAAKKQIILYGPPGTGKTFKTKKYSIDFLKGGYR